MTYPDGEDKHSPWNEQDGMYYDAIQWGVRLPVRSLVGLIPLYATVTLEPSVVNQFPRFKKRMNWFLENGGVRTEHGKYERFVTFSVIALVFYYSTKCAARGRGERFLLELASKDRLISILKKMLDESEFFSDTAFDHLGGWIAADSSDLL
ncbi:hypothetical protein EDB83DRAFT_165716 [Lactarius deliciosus]|nr:hypothetical protein EDB83DRAFT_165716 [Lactarius deliciosus]